MTEVRGLFDRALARIPGGVNSPVRAFGSVGGQPFFAVRAEGPAVWDTEGRRYLDLVQSWGASILGHADPELVDAVHPGRPGRYVLRHPDRGRGPPGRGGLRPGPVGREAPPRVLRDRGHHDRRPSGPRRHRSRSHPQVRRLLPRPRRRPAGFGRQWPGHPRSPRVGRGPRRGGGRHRGRPLQRRSGPRRGVRPPRPAVGGGDRRGSGGQHGARPAGPRLPRRAPESVHGDRSPADRGRGHHRVPPRRRRSPGPLRHRARPLVLREGPGRRSPAGGLRRADRDHGPPRPPRGPCTRPAPCRGTRWPPQPVSPSSPGSTPPPTPVWRPPPPPWPTASARR